ncbi:hypothetical protein XENOCAPTIV_023438 [Xenoophorus captivus]|uniref:Uncharacterized protein n=1 Tax=Xenoophorus captivus TaxID=1517983 RepID=A0ABV0S0Z9_9TELE
MVLRDRREHLGSREKMESPVIQECRVLQGRSGESLTSLLMLASAHTSCVSASHRTCLNGCFSVSRFVTSDVLDVAVQATSKEARWSVVF